jgi:beta-glucosidase
LPLERGRVRRIAVIGPNADVPLMQGGGSAAVVPSRLPTPLESLRRLAGNGIEVTYARGVDNDTLPAAVDHRLLSPDRQRRQTGLRFAYYSGARIGGTAVHQGVETYFDKTLFAAELGQMAARWEGWFWPPADGEYEWRLAARGEGTLTLDDQVVIGAGAGTRLASASDFLDTGKVGRMVLRKGRGYRLRVDYVSTPASFHQMQLGVRLPEPALAEAVDAARQADAAIVFVGVSRTSESEGRDRPDMQLHGRQNELVEAVLAANPRSIVVLNNGAPLELPWLARAPAVVEAWLPGQGGADALAQILFGDANPSGRLPFTFPKRLEDNPGYLHYGGGRDAFYGEGVFVGYRYYDTRRLEPLFAFGHGLSYTRFEYSNLRVPQSADGRFEVSVDVRNVGQRAGAEVVQLYVGDAATREVRRPDKELKGFAKVALAPGEVRTVRLPLVARDLAYYDVHVRDWVTTPGRHSVQVGASAADIRLRQDFTWTAAPDRRLPAEVQAQGE